MTTAHLRLILIAKTESKAGIILKRFLQDVSGEVQSLKPYHKGGYEAVLAVAVHPGDWALQALHLISLAQTFGRGWYLTGEILEVVDMTTTDFSFPGLSFAWLTLSKASDEC